MERRITAKELNANFKGTKWEKTMKDLTPFIDSFPETMYRRKYDIDGKSFINFYLFWANVNDQKLGAYKSSTFRNFVSIDLVKTNDNLALPILKGISDMYTPAISSAWAPMLVKNKEEFFSLLRENITTERLHSYIMYKGNDDFTAWCVLSRLFSETTRAHIYRKVMGIGKAPHASKHPQI